MNFYELLIFLWRLNNNNNNNFLLHQLQPEADVIHTCKIIAKIL